MRIPFFFTRQKRRNLLVRVSPQTCRDLSTRDLPKEWILGRQFRVNNATRSATREKICQPDSSSLVFARRPKKLPLLYLLLPLLSILLLTLPHWKVTQRFFTFSLFRFKTSSLKYIYIYIILVHRTTAVWIGWKGGKNSRGANYGGKKRRDNVCFLFNPSFRAGRVERDDAPRPR